MISRIKKINPGALKKPVEKKVNTKKMYPRKSAKQSGNPSGANFLGKDSKPLPPSYFKNLRK